MKKFVDHTLARGFVQCSTFQQLYLYIQSLIAFIFLTLFRRVWGNIPTPSKKNEGFAEFKRIKQKFLAKDKYGQLVFLADSDFTIQMTQSKYQSVKLFFTSEEISG